MAFIRINDIEIEVSDGIDLIEAAKLAEIEIPHYCYHPGLSRPANCRMCLVEPQQFFPPAGKIVPARQLATACNTVVKSLPPDRKLDGKYDFIVRTDSDRVKKAREDILEFILIHHPLDCPVCDQAGECALQNFSFSHGKGTSRYVESKNVPPKKELGPDVLLYSTRCIVCTRCIRFCDEVSGTSELGLTNRGSHNQIDIHRDRDENPIQELDNKLAGNVVDICPVGALVSKDFLFRSRPWFLKKVDSICPGCAVGCNITVEFKENEIYRLKPRFNEEINQHWICDDGRFGYHYVNSEDRLKTPMKKEGNKFIPIGWNDAIKLMHQKFAKIKKKDLMALVGSAYGTNEENYLLRKFADRLKVNTVGLIGQKLGKEHKFPKFTISADKNPNSRGSREMLGENVMEGTQLWSKLRKSKVAYIISGIPNLSIDRTMSSALRKIDFLVVQDIFLSELAMTADLVLPGVTFAEKNGTFTNSGGFVQRIHRAIEAPGDARTDWKIIQEIAQKFGCEMAYYFAGEISKSIDEREEVS